MNVVHLREAKPLQGGFYSFSEAARILEMDTTTNIKNWVVGNARSGAVIARQYPKSQNEMGFYDLIEIRFISYFRKQGISLQSIRKAALKARAELDARHPFAVKYVTDRKRIFELSAEETRDRKLIELITGQYEMYEVIEDFLAKGVEFNPDGLAKSWRPEPRAFPKVVLDPRKAHGQPIIAGADVPTRAVFDLWLAEQRDMATVSDWFEIPEGDVEQAIEYELGLAA